MPKNLSAALAAAIAEGLLSVRVADALRRLEALGFKVSVRTLSRWRAEAGAPRPPSPRRGSSIVPEEAILGPESCTEVARRYGVSHQLISRRRRVLRLREMP